ncbi:MAG: serine protease [Chloroflexota bacterium]
MNGNRNSSLGCGILIGIGLCLIGMIALVFFFAPFKDSLLGSFFMAESTKEPEKLPATRPTKSIAKPSQKPPAAATAPLAVLPLSPGAIVPFQAVVKVSAIYKGKELWNGSGSVITTDGLILTNAHVVLPEKPYQVDALLISFTEKEDQAPKPTYFAEVMQADPDLDVAVLRVTKDVNGNDVDRARLQLPTVPLGSSDDVHIGDSLTIIGYPGIGGMTITLTRGDVAGFTSDAKFGDRAFIKTSATIAGGNSGGLGANNKGQLVGIPTQLGYGGDGQFVDCRPLADTNRDGVIDDRDNCVPTGGFINALRPVNLMVPLIEAAKRGEVAVGITHAQSQNLPETGQTLFSDDFSNPDSGWDNINGQTGATHYANGQYNVSVVPPRTLVWGTPKKNFEDVIIQVNAKPLSYNGDEDFGIICRYQDSDNFYALEVSADGYYSIWKAENGERIILIDWQASYDIPQNGDEIVLAAACVGNQLGLAVNGQLIAEAQDTSFTGGDVGLIAGTWDTGGFNVGFDNYLVKKP